MFFEKRNDKPFENRKQRVETETFITADNRFININYEIGIVIFKFNIKNLLRPYYFIIFG